MKLQSRLAVCVFELTDAGARVQLLPAGEFRARDGRPHDVPAWRMDAAIAQRLIADLNARNTDVVIDYEHQTLYSALNGQAAPAAGWLKNVEWIEGKGLFATDARWTARARQMIDAEEYRYISPVFKYDSTGAPVRLLHVALTNDPAVDGMDDLQTRVAAKFSIDDDPEDSAVNLLEQIRKALGLDDQADESAVTTAVAALKTGHDNLQGELVKTLGLDEKADTKTIANAVAALKADNTAKDESIAALKTGEPDPAKYVPVNVVEELKTEVAALKSAQVDSQVDDLVTEALTDGRLLPAQEEWARKLGKSDIAALKQYIDTAQPIAALNNRQTQGKQFDKDGNVTLTEDQIAICKSLGIDQEEYKKQLKAEAEAAA